MIYRILQEPIFEEKNPTFKEKDIYIFQQPTFKENDIYNFTTTNHKNKPRKGGVVGEP
jgi:hypothetical protein